jgi:DNA helicase HerA-like ATPase
MQGTHWGFMVIGQPLGPEAAMTHFNRIVMDMRKVTLSEPQLSPLANAYLELLDSYKGLFVAASSGGLWSTQVYAFTRQESDFQRLRAGINLCFGVGDAVTDPVRTTRAEGLADVVPRFGQIVTPGVPSPMEFQRPLLFQTSMHSELVSALAHLPRQEMPGFIVRDQARFDVAPHQPPEEGAIELGQILDLGRPLGDHYRVSRGALNKHALVVGGTGSGKTNTIFHVLRSAWKAGTPFLVLEPAKSEYRALLADEVIGPALQVFTVGDETVSPFRMNPFAVEPGASVATHIDLLKATFNASFAMWPPLPQVLERCIHGIYEDRGWDIMRNRNRRLSEGEWESGSPTAALSFPTLTELHRKIEEVVSRLGYEERVTSDIRAALSTRIHSLRLGGKGAMLDTQHGVGFESLLDRPTVFELEQVGDDEEKAFIMGLLLMRIYERHRARGVAEGGDLSHLIVIEEAHRLLARVPERQASAEAANPRGKAVEAFVNMLSEVRAYGQGFLVAEQIPAKLALDVVKNTNVKVVHRTVAADDRELVGQTMNMQQRQFEVLATVPCGEAAVFAEGDDRPILIKVPYAKLTPSEAMATHRGSNAVVAERMRPLRAEGAASRAYVPFPEVPDSAAWPGELIDFGRSMADRTTARELFMAVVLAALEHPPALEVARERLRRHVEQHAPRFTDAGEAFRSVAAHLVQWYVTHLGRRFEWPYEHVPVLSRHLADVVLSADEGAVDGLRESYGAACGPARGESLPGGVDAERAAIYRYHTETLLTDGALTEMFDIGMADAADEGAWSDRRALDQAVARLGGYDLTPSTRFGLALAYGLQQILYKPGLLQLARDMATERLVEALREEYAAEDVGEAPAPSAALASGPGLGATGAPA